jgi:hypothetical protein
MRASSVHGGIDWLKYASKVVQESQQDVVDLVRTLLGRGMADSGHLDDFPHVWEVDAERRVSRSLPIDAKQRLQRRIAFAGQKQRGLLDNCPVEKRRDLPAPVYRGVPLVRPTDAVAGVFTDVVVKCLLAEICRQRSLTAEMRLRV